MNDLKIGQVLSLKIKIDYFGEFKEKHPYLILDIVENGDVIEVGQLHSLEGKGFEAITEKNKVIFKTQPNETVIDKDSFIQLHNKIRIENFDELSQYRRQVDVLSKDKLKQVVEAYKNYHKKHHIEDARSVFLKKEDIEELN